MNSAPRVYGDAHRYKATLKRHVARATELLDRLEGVKLMITAEDNWIVRSILEQEWVDEVEQFRVMVWRATRKHLAGQGTEYLPLTTRDWPPATGKPRHKREIAWVEPWLRECASELATLLDRLGVSRNVAAVAGPAAEFSELGSSGLIEPAVVEGLAKVMREPRTPKQLTDAIGASKELMEAT